MSYELGSKWYNQCKMAKDMEQKTALDKSPIIMIKYLLSQSGLVWQKR